MQIRIEAQFAPEPNLPPALPATSAQRGAGGSTRAWWATAVGAYVLLCLPLLLVDVPPLTDYPNHMARMDILAQLGREPFLTQVYQARWEVIPDLAIDSFMPWLVTVLPVDVAGRLLLAAILLLDLAGVTACAAALHGRRTWWSLGAALAAYNMSFLMGFLSFNLTLATAMVAAAAWMRLRGGTSAIATATFGAGAASVLFIGHLLGLLFFALLIGSFEVPLARMRLRNAAPDIASRARAFLASWPLAVSAAPPALLYAISGVSAARDRPRWPIWSDLPIEAMAAFLNYNWPVDVVTACLVVAFLAGCTMWSRLRVAPGAAVAVVAVCVLIPLLPHDFKGGSYFAMRLGVMLGFLAFLSFRPALAGRCARIIAAAFALLFVTRMAIVSTAWWDFRTDISNTRTLLRNVNRGERLAELNFEPEDVPDYFSNVPTSWRISNHQRTTIHLMAMAVTERRAFWPMVFANPDQQPLVLDPHWQSLAEPTLKLPSYADLVKRRASGKASGANPFCAFDWVILQNTWTEPNPETLAPEWLALVASNRTGALYRSRAARDCRSGPEAMIVPASASTP